MFSNSFVAGILTPFVLVMAAVISAANGQWLLFTFFSCVTAMTVAGVVKQWPYLRFVMWGAVVIACVVVAVFMCIELPWWVTGVIMVLFTARGVAAINKRPGKESLRINRR
ncbi:hypothetical protein [Spirillospora sp. CA-128828]|uniref:hypothetical protein n=1 Tax=Spirillospora sp. CA-128828 TaxID=3240033 RepID=UPI003D8BE376